MLDWDRELAGIEVVRGPRAYRIETDILGNLVVMFEFGVPVADCAIHPFYIDAVFSRELTAEAEQCGFLPDRRRACEAGDASACGRIDPDDGAAVFADVAVVRLEGFFPPPWAPARTPRVPLQPMRLLDADEAPALATGELATIVGYGGVGADDVSLEGVGLRRFLPDVELLSVGEDELRIDGRRGGTSKRLSHPNRSSLSGASLCPQSSSSPRPRIGSSWRTTSSGSPPRSRGLGCRPPVRAMPV